MAAVVIIEVAAIGFGDRADCGEKGQDGDRQIVAGKAGDGTDKQRSAAAGAAAVEKVRESEIVPAAADERREGRSQTGGATDSEP